MELEDILTQFNFREEPAERLTQKHGIKKGHHIVDTPEWHKFISPETGIGLFVETYTNSKAILGIEVLFPLSFEETYWRTLERLGEETGFTFDEIKRRDYREEHVKHWSNNYHYLQEVENLYSSLIQRLKFIVEKAFAGSSFEEEWGTPEIGYVDLTYHNLKVTLEPRKNLYLVMHQPANIAIHTKLEELRDFIAALPGITDKIKDTWQKVEDGTLAYARHLKDVYQPVLPTTMAQTG